MIILASTNEILELVTSAAVNVDVYAAWADITSTTFIADATETAITTAATTTVVDAPAASTQRQIKYLSAKNKASTGSVNVTLQKDVAGANYELSPTITLGAQETLVFNENTGIHVLDRNGRIKEALPDAVGYNGRPYEYYKIGTAAEAVGVRYGFAKDSGFPGAWVPGAPGINGWWTDASQASNAANPAGATQVGCQQYINPSSGTNYLTQVGISTSVAHLLSIVDLLWYNTGIAVTTTTAQAIAQPGTSIPARDATGSTNGEGWNAGIYVTTATTNAGAITNTTLNYTNSDGVAGRTATISSFPATAVVGTFVPFQLAAGDRGIRSIQGITLGTSYGGGAISLVMYRMLCTVPNPVVNVGGIMSSAIGRLPDPGVKLYNGTALWLFYLASATTATTLSGSLQIMEK